MRLLMLQEVMMHNGIDSFWNIQCLLPLVSEFHTLPVYSDVPSDKLAECNIGVKPSHDPMLNRL